MTNSNDVLVERISNLQYVVERQEARIKELENELENMERNISERDRKNLLWDISVLGGVVTTLIGVLWNYRSVIFR